MIKISGFAGLFTEGTILFTNGLIHLYIHYNGVDCSSGTKQVLWYGTYGQLYILSNKIYFEVYAGKGETDGLWSGNCTASDGRILLTWWWFLTTVDPTIYLNGSAVTMTENATPSAIEAPTAVKWYFGDTDGSGTNRLQGNIGEIAVWNPTLTAGEYLTEAQCLMLTSAKVKRLPLQLVPAKLMYYWPCDEAPNGQAIRSWLAGTGILTTLKPNADVDPQWATATPHYSKINDWSDATLISASDVDDGQTDKVGFETATIPTGKSLFGVRMIVRAKAGDAGSFTYSLQLSGSAVITRTVTSTTLAQYTDYYEGAISQSDVDGAEFWATAATTIDKGENGGYIYDVVSLFEYMVYPIRCMKSGKNLYTFGVTQGIADPSHSYA